MHKSNESFCLWMKNPKNFTYSYLRLHVSIRWNVTLDLMHFWQSKIWAQRILYKEYQTIPLKRCFRGPNCNQPTVKAFQLENLFEEISKMHKNFKSQKSARHSLPELLHRHCRTGQSRTNRMKEFFCNFHGESLSKHFFSQIFNSY